MNHFASYLGIVATLFVGIFIAAFYSTHSTLPVSTATIPTSSSTLSVAPPSPPLPLPSEVNIATSTPSSVIPAPKKKVTALPPPTVSTSSAPKPVSVPTAPTQSGSAALDTAASALRSALVNIICNVSAASGLHSISGSGVFIDPKGIILTNAHVAQHFLLADRNVSCIIRSGSPATNSYTAALLYISPIWLKTNADAIIETLPSGTGEYDFALLAVSKSTTSITLPTIFPFVPLATTPPISGTPVVIASYGAQFLESNQIRNFLFPTVVFGSVKDVFTFATNTIDVLALGGSVAAQEGSSGGGVADASGALVGTITTSTVEGATDTRSLNAITASYIRAEYASETGSALDILLSKPISTAISDFAPQIPALESILTARLP